jgi:hypothetical protein
VYANELDGREYACEKKPANRLLDIFQDYS